MGHTLGPFVDIARAALRDPLLGAVLGVVFGIGLLVLSERSFRLMTPESGPAGYALTGLLLFARMGLVVAAMLGYRAFARSGAVAFGVAAALSFLAAYGVQLVRYSGVLKSRSRRRASGTA